MADTVVALEYGHLVEGIFKPTGPVYKHPGFKPFTSKSREGQFGKPSFAETYHLEVPDNCIVAIAAKKRTGGRTIQVDFVYEVLYAPESER